MARMGRGVGRKPFLQEFCFLPTNGRGCLRQQEAPRPLPRTKAAVRNTLRLSPQHCICSSDVTFSPVWKISRKPYRILDRLTGNRLPEWYPHTPAKAPVLESRGKRIISDQSGSAG